MKKLLKAFIIITLLVTVLGLIVCYKLGLFSTFKNVVNQMIGKSTSLNINTEDMESIDGDSQTFVSEEVKELVLKCQYGTFNVEKTEDTDVKIKVDKNVDKVKYKLDDGVLTIATVSKPSIREKDEVELTLYVPETVLFTNADIEIGAGNLNFTNIVLSKMDINVGAGNINFENVRASDVVCKVNAGEITNKNVEFSSLDVDVDAGKYNFDGFIAHDINLNCNVGDVKMNIDGAYQNYNTNVTCNLGTVTVGPNIYSGNVENKMVDNDSLYNIYIKCNVGNIEVNFKE